MLWSTLYHFTEWPRVQHQSNPPKMGENLIENQRIQIIDSSAWWEGKCSMGPTFSSYNWIIFVTLQRRNSCSLGSPLFDIWIDCFWEACPRAAFEPFGVLGTQLCSRPSPTPACSSLTSEPGKSKMANFQFPGGVLHKLIPRPCSCGKGLSLRTSQGIPWEKWLGLQSCCSLGRARKGVLRTSFRAGAIVPLCLLRQGNALYTRLCFPDTVYCLLLGSGSYISLLPGK